MKETLEFLADRHLHATGRLQCSLAHAAKDMHGRSRLVVCTCLTPAPNPFAILPCSTPAVAASLGLQVACACSGHQ